MWPDLWLWPWCECLCGSSAGQGWLLEGPEGLLGVGWEVGVWRRLLPASTEVLMDQHRGQDVWSLQRGLTRAGVGRLGCHHSPLSLSHTGEHRGLWDGWGGAGPAWGPTQGAVWQFWHDGHRVPGTGGTHRPLPRVELGGGGPGAPGDAASGQPLGQGKVWGRRQVAGSGCSFCPGRGGVQSTRVTTSNILAVCAPSCYNLISRKKKPNGWDPTVWFACVVRAHWNLCPGRKVCPEHLRWRERKRGNKSTFSNSCSLWVILRTLYSSLGQKEGTEISLEEKKKTASKLPLTGWIDCCYDFHSQ